MGNASTVIGSDKESDKMATKAKEHRDEAEVHLIGAYQDLQEVVAETPVRKRAVGKAVSNLAQAWEKLQKRHAEYCRLGKISLSSTESMEYLREKGKLRREAMTAAEELLGNSGEDEDRKATTNLETELFQLKLGVEGDLGALAGLISGNLSIEQHVQTQGILGEVEANLNRFMECSSELVQYMEEEARKKKIEEAETFYKTHFLKFKEYRGAVVKKAPVKVETKPSVGPAAPGQHGSGGAVARDGRQPVKIKAMDCPKWDGRFRTFVRFKKLWEENIEPRHEDSAQHYMLCQSLPRKVLDNISTLSNSAADIWAYLDEKYGRPEIVAREVMAELMSLDHKKLGQVFMGKFCTMLLDTHSLLATLNEVEWLVTNKSVAEMEDKLPREERLEWAKQMGAVTGDTRFEKFKNFLMSRKSVLESVELMGCRSVGDDSVGVKCEYCSRPGHTADECYTKQRKQGGQPGGGNIPRGKGGCAICNSEDHWKNECPEKGSAKDKRSGRKANSLRGGQSSGGAGGGGAVSAEVGSNTLRAQECPRCKAASKLSYCAGCHKTASITHCLLHCESYMILSVKDRADLVRSSKTCAICLHSSHTADKCFNKDKDNYVCGVGGCQSHHHPSLHGSKDIYVTGVNVLLRQRTQAVTTSCQDAFLPVNNWVDREQYLYDSFPREEEDCQVLQGVVF